MDMDQTGMARCCVPDHGPDISTCPNQGPPSEGPTTCLEAPRDPAMVQRIMRRVSREVIPPPLNRYHVPHTMRM